MYYLPPKFKTIIKSLSTIVWPISYRHGGSFKVSRIVKTISKYRIALDLDLSQLVDKAYAFGIYNKKSIDFLINRIQLFDCAWFVDAGSNLGFYSFAIASTSKSVKCLAIEPDPYSQAKFESNIILNSGIHRLVERIYLERSALTTHEGKVDLMINDCGNRGGSSICIDQRKFTGKTSNTSIRVPSKRLSTLLKSYKIEDFRWCLKLDIEGFEYPIIQSFLDDLPEDQHPRAIVVEWTGTGMTGVGDETPIKLLQRSGYTLNDIEGSENYLFTKN